MRVVCGRIPDRYGGLSRVTPTLTADDFEEAFSRIKACIAEAETYQANYTFRPEGMFSIRGSFGARQGYGWSIPFKGGGPPC